MLISICRRNGCKKELVELFLAKGADVNTINSRGSSPAGIAAREEYQEIKDICSEDQ